MSAEPSYARPAPRCYRRPSAKTAVQSRVQVHGSTILLMLSLDSHGDRGVPDRLSWFVSVMRGPRRALGTGVLNQQQG
jgi:hypothetical protein